MLKNLCRVLAIFLVITGCSREDFMQEATPKNGITSTNVSQSKISLGAYYFDGWTGTYPYHITPALRDSFPEREPKWGWITSTQTIMNEQINLAADAGLSFFSFCWYYNGEKDLPLNNALDFYKNSPNQTRLKYCLMVANHTGSEIGPENWEQVIDLWLPHLKSETYLKVADMPVLIFFSANELVSQFKSTQNVSKALHTLKEQAVKNGLKGVVVAVCTGGDQESVRTAEECGFDLLTGYNYHDAGFTDSQERQFSINNLVEKEVSVWNGFKSSKLNYIPVSTLNWDARPWASTSSYYASSPYFYGYSPESVSESVMSVKRWIGNHPEKVTKEKLALLYAWNEYGEGAYLTPTKSDSNSLLRAVKMALDAN